MGSRHSGGIHTVCHLAVADPCDAANAGDLDWPIFVYGSGYDSGNGPAGHGTLGNTTETIRNDAAGTALCVCVTGTAGNS